jgi:hypothetical protein
MAITSASKTVVGIFDSMSEAENAVRALEGAGIARDDVSVVANKNVTGSSENTGTETAGTDTAGTTSAGNVAADAGIGAALGGVGGLLLSFAGLAIPGIGPILAAGPIVAALGGAGIGAVAGGVIGALTESGVPEDEAQYYAEGVRRGQVLVTVHTDENRADQAREILDSNGAVDVEGRASEWRNKGWSGYNAGAEPLSADELRREREYYSAADRQGDEWRREEREQRQTGSAPGGGTLEGTRWPHTEAQPIGQSLTGAEASNAGIDAGRRETGSSLGDASPTRSDIDSPSSYTETVENDTRRPDRATTRIEQGFERAKDSAERSARRLGSRIYDATHK